MVPIPQYDPIIGAFPDVPVVPLPNPGEGGPVASGGVIILPNLPNWGGMLPGITGRTAQVRFFNAAFGYESLRVMIGGRMAANALGYATFTGYGRVASGFQTVTVTNRSGAVYLQKSMPLRAGDKTTLAIVNTASGLDLLSISDDSCERPRGMSCIRVSNLAYNSPPVDVMLYDGRTVYSDVRYKETTAFKRIRPGSYQFYLTETSLRPTPRLLEDIETLDSPVQAMLPEALVSFFVDVRPNASYTVYILSQGNRPGNIRTLVAEDR